MRALRQAGTSRSILFLNSLLLSTAVALPAMAQIEQVVVTAQKRTEDVQTVPITVTAFTAQDLADQRISQPKDLQFHDPSVTYTAGNFRGADFQIRGIGVTAIGYDTESGVALDFDEVYLASPQITEGAFFDLGDVEVLRGPQSTLYGRGASGGVVNIGIAKPDLENASFALNGTIGNYSAYTVSGVVNLPLITDVLGLRVSGEWDKRDGFVTNVYDGSNTDGLDQKSVRGTLRWQPSEKTTVDFTVQIQHENDDHLRGDKQLCTQDPTGVLGCLPGSAGTQAENAYSNLSLIASSQQGLENAFAGTPLAALAPFLGLYNLTNQFATPAGFVDPTGSRQVNTSFKPVWNSQDNFMSLKWQQTVTPWLSSNLILGYDRDASYSLESYNNIPGFPLPQFHGSVATGLPFPVDQSACLNVLFTNNPNLQCAEHAFLGALTGVAGPAYAAHYAPFFLTQPGSLPISGLDHMGTISGSYALTPNNTAYDQSDGAASQQSVEWRLNTSFTGPLNAMVGFYYLHTHSTGDYYVRATTLDYPAIILGGFLGLANPACQASGCILSPSYYHNQGSYANLRSQSVFGEVYYDAIPDTLKFTVGLRFTDDVKTQSDRVLLFNLGLEPIGTQNENNLPGLYDKTHQSFQKITGRAVVDWTPKLDFTDQTLVYASFARGYKAGGANPGIQVDNNPFGLPLTYKPEFINAFEVGTKDQLLHNTLQVNADAYYYDYSGLQVSAIESNTSINENINAKVYGQEASFTWVPIDRLQFGLNFAHEDSNIQNTHLVDTRNPTAGDPNTLLVKDDTVSGNTGSNCVLYFTGAFPGLPAGYVAPAGGVGALASSGISHVAFGACPTGAAPPGYSLTGPNGGTLEGEPVNLSGNELQNTPNLAVTLSAQYTQPLPSDYTLQARVDVHWQSHFWGRVFEDGADKIGSQETTNASLQLNPPDDLWYAQAFIKNIFNQNNMTGQYLTSQTSGLYTNAFYGDPRTYGLTLGIKFQ
jgi:outer membrane receptor protein involved in Fe transport